MTTVVVTGANGFVGRAVGRRLAAAGHAVHGAVRRNAALPEGVTPVAGPVLSREADWRPVLDGMEAVVHLAARVHVMKDDAADPLAAFRAVNVAGTRALAEQAAATGVRRFVFVSSVKALGDGRADGRPYSEADAPAPRDPYGVSKWEAEQALREIAGRTGMEVVVVRPPLVYGPGVKGNFAALLRLVARGVPLPFGAIGNRRSLIGVENLADALRLCLEHPQAAGETFLVRDGEDVSTPDLVNRLAGAFGRPARLVPVPPAVLRLGLGVLGKGAAADRLLGSLTVDDARLRSRLGWTPPLTLDEGLARTVAAFRRAG